MNSRRIACVVRAYPSGGVHRWAARMARRDPSWNLILLGDCGEVVEGARTIPEFWELCAAERISLLAREIEELDADVVVGNDVREAYAAAAMTRARRVLAAHGEDHTWMEVCDACGGLAEGWVSVSSGARAALAPWFDAWTREAVIPCGVEIGKAETRRALDENDTLRIAWVGRLEDRHKRAWDLVALADALDATGMPYSIDVVGEGPLRARLESALAGQIGRGAVRMHGWVAPGDVARLLGRADALVMTSSHEGTPLAGMEAMASGLALLVTEGCGGVVGAVREGACGAVVGVGDMGSMARAAQAIRGSLDVMSRASVREAAARFDIAQSVARWHGFARSLTLGEPAAPSLDDVWTCVMACDGAGVSDADAVCVSVARRWGLVGGASGRERPPVAARLLIETLEALSRGGARRVALAGAGRHTQRLARWIEWLSDAIKPVVILDGDAADGQEIGGVPVRRFADFGPDVDAVVVSSDGHERALVGSSESWAEGSRNGVWIIPLYEPWGSHLPIATASAWRGGGLGDPRVGLRTA